MPVLQQRLYYSSPRSLQPKGSETPNQNKGKARLASKDGQDVSVSVSAASKGSNLSGSATSKTGELTKTFRQAQEVLQPRNLDLEGGEDAEENKSKLTVLAEDLGKFHLGTPARVYKKGNINEVGSATPKTGERTNTFCRAPEVLQPRNLDLEVGEDAEENKSNLKVLAEDLDKFHLGTPGRVTTISASAHHEFSMRSVNSSELHQSETGPITSDELSTQDLEFQDGANLDLDFFTRLGNTEAVVKSSLARDSLYIKFDPIVGAIVSQTVSDSFAMPPLTAPEGVETSSEEPQDSQEEDQDQSQGESQPQRTPSRTPALEAVQKLISLTPSSGSSGTPVRTPSTPARSGRGSMEGSNPNTLSPRITPENLKREKMKLEESMKAQALAYKAELDKRDAELQEKAAKVSELEAELKAEMERELKLRTEVQERTKSRQRLSLVMKEYEKTLLWLVAQTEEEKKEFEVQKDLLMKERDTAMQHLNNMEIAFKDVHQKYEHSKTVIEGMKANEDVLKKRLAEYDEAVKTSSLRYDSLKYHAVRQLDTANHELDLIRRSHQVELAKLKAMLKKAEVRVTSLEESLEQKSKNNQELLAICDELIATVGSVAK